MNGSWTNWKILPSPFEKNLPLLKSDTGWPTYLKIWCHMWMLPYPSYKSFFSLYSNLNSEWQASKIQKVIKLIGKRWVENYGIFTKKSIWRLDPEFWLGDLFVCLFVWSGVWAQTLPVGIAARLWCSTCVIPGMF